MLKLRGKTVNGTEELRAHEGIAVMRKERSARRDRQDLRSLIVNADDLGWTEGVNRGIAEAHRNGIVTSASLLANGAAFESGVELAQTTPGLGIGVHLNLSDGEPVAERELVTTLLNDRGDLEGRPQSLLLRLARRSVLLEEVEREWDAQIQKVRDFGVEPTHLDGHRHVQMLPGVVLRLCLCGWRRTRDCRIPDFA